MNSFQFVLFLEEYLAKKDIKIRQKEDVTIRH